MNRRTVQDFMIQVLGYFFHTIFLIGFLVLQAQTIHIQAVLSNLNISDVVFVSQYESSRYAYMDAFYGPRPKAGATVINADVYLQPEIANNVEDLFSKSWTLQPMPPLTGHEVAVSRNLALRYGLEIGDVITINEVPWQVKVFLPSMIGLYEPTSRDGVLLFAFDATLQVQATQYMYFNENPLAIFSDSQVFRMRVYAQDQTFLIGNSIFVVMSFLLPILLIINLPLLARRIYVWSKEARKHRSQFHYLLKTFILPYAFVLLMVKGLSLIVIMQQYATTLIPMLGMLFLLSLLSLILASLYMLWIHHRLKGIHHG
jgi:hypothetical protein